MDEAYLKILSMIQDGTISAEQGEMLLDALHRSSEPESQLAGERQVKAEMILTHLSNDRQPSTVGGHCG
jgi:polyhydroxyalkanoate synthesis regulator phasin